MREFRNYTALYYVTLDEYLDKNYYQSLLELERWRNITNAPKYVAPPKVGRLHKLVREVKYEQGFDNYIIDKSGILGVMYSYALHDPDVLKTIVEQTREYEANILAKPLNYEDPNIWFSIHQFLKNIY